MFKVPSLDPIALQLPSHFSTSLYSKTPQNNFLCPLSTMNSFPFSLVLTTTRLSSPSLYWSALVKTRMTCSTELTYWKHLIPFLSLSSLKYFLHLVWEEPTLGTLDSWFSLLDIIFTQIFVFHSIALFHIFVQILFSYCNSFLYLLNFLHLPTFKFYLYLSPAIFSFIAVFAVNYIFYSLIYL